VVGELRQVVPYEFKVETAPRRTPVTHREFDLARLHQALPEFRFTPLREGLRRTFEAAA
jgi:hypothetical protein